MSAIVHTIPSPPYQPLPFSPSVLSSRIGIGLRVGAVVHVSNAHAVVSGSRLVGLACCAVSQVAVVRFAPLPAPGAPRLPATASRLMRLASASRAGLPLASYLLVLQWHEQLVAKLHAAGDSPEGNVDAAARGAALRLLLGHKRPRANQLFQQADAVLAGGQPARGLLEQLMQIACLQPEPRDLADEFFHHRSGGACGIGLVNGGVRVGTHTLIHIPTPSIQHYRAPPAMAMALGPWPVLVEVGALVTEAAAAVARSDSASTTASASSSSSPPPPCSPRSALHVDYIQSCGSVAPGESTAGMWGAQIVHVRGLLVGMLRCSAAGDWELFDATGGVPAVLLGTAPPQPPPAPGALHVFLRAAVVLESDHGFSQVGKDCKRAALAAYVLLDMADSRELKVWRGEGGEQAASMAKRRRGEEAARDGCIVRVLSRGRIKHAYDAEREWEAGGGRRWLTSCISTRLGMM